MSLTFYLYYGNEEQFHEDGKGEVFSNVTTHNLVPMAEAAGCYEVLWRPDEHGKEFAEQILLTLRASMHELVRNREYFEQFNPPNGWGSYDSFVDFVGDVLRACERWPDAKIYACR